jgi:ABC-2 type transport system permease protein
MKKFLTLLGREVKAFFYSPIAYVVLCALLFVTGFNFYTAVSIMNLQTREFTVVEAFFNTVLFWFPFVLVFPLLTMRVFAEEFKMGTIETLLTAPVRDWQVVLSKYLGTLVFFIVLWLPSFLYFAAFQQITKTDAAHAAGAYLGSYLLLLLIGMFYLSIGCLASALTRNQIIAAVIAFAAIVVFFFTGLLSFIIPNVSPALRTLIEYFSTIEHMGMFSKGIIDSRPIVYYLSMTALMLFLTHHVLQSRKWRS